MIRKIICLLVCLATAFAVSGCAKEEKENKKPTTIGNDELLLQKTEVEKNLELTNEAIVNPFMGFAVDATSEGAAEKTSLVYIDITFKELQPNSADDFDFETIETENNIAKYKEQGKHAVLRFICDKPSDIAHRDIPDWLYNKTGDGTDYDTSYGKGYSPDYNNEVFIKYHENAVKALGSHFYKDNFISYVELGSLGHWGEWHVKYQDGIKRIPTADIRERYIAPYIKAFSNCKILMRRPFNTAVTNGFGLYNDMAGEPKATKEWLDWIENGGDYAQAQEKNAFSPMLNAWQTAPIGGELNSKLTMDYMCKKKLAQTKKLISKTHTTFLGPMCPISSSKKYDDKLYKKAVKELLRNMGYRIGITKMKISKTNSKGIARIELQWKNDGVAPLYFNLPVKLYQTDIYGNIKKYFDVEIDLTTLLPGQTITTKTDVKIGTDNAGTEILLGIVDPLTEMPAVLLVNDLERIDKMTKLYSYK